MDALSHRMPAFRLVLELDPSPDGRLEGRVGTDAGDSWTPFSGVLELLKVLEETLRGVDSAARNPTMEGTES